jgi:hypothetical protein
MASGHGFAGVFSVFGYEFHRDALLGLKLLIGARANRHPVTWQHARCRQGAP